MKISKQLIWMFGLGFLSFTLVGVGTASSPRDAQAAAAAESSPICPPVTAPASQPVRAVAELAPEGVGTGGAAGSGPPLNTATDTRAFAIAAASPKVPSSTSLVFLPLWSRQ